MAADGVLMARVVGLLLGRCGWEAMSQVQSFWNGHVGSSRQLRLDDARLFAALYDDLFTYGINEGKEITVKCIGETTKARKP